jgi:hypothetical protein
MASEGRNFVPWEKVVEMVTIAEASLDLWYELSENEN